MPFDERRERYFDKKRSEHPALGLLDYHHIPLALIRDHFPDDFACLLEYESFALIRDPFERFASSLHEYLHWNHGRKLAHLTSAQVADLAADAMRQLQPHSGGSPVTEPSLIHFSRQSDYVELGDERIVKRLFSMEELDAMMTAIGKAIGQTIVHRPVNQRIRYRTELLQRVSERAQRILRIAAPERLARPVLNMSRKTMVRAGLVKLDQKIPFKEIFGSDVESFVREFYARDIELRELVARRDTAAA